MTRIVGSYVDGRPMPRSSSALIKLASVYRGGGVVSWPSACSSRASNGSPAAIGGKPALLVVRARAVVVPALLVGGQEAAEGDDRAGRGELERPGRRRRWPPSRTVAVEPRASAIWEATVRFQMSS